MNQLLKEIDELYGLQLVWGDLTTKLKEQLDSKISELHYRLGSGENPPNWDEASPATQRLLVGLQGEFRAGGPLVYDWGTHFLRDDYELRKDAGCFENDELQAFSLFCVDPYGRRMVFSGCDKEFAIRQAEKLIKEDENATCDNEAS